MRKIQVLFTGIFLLLLVTVQAQQNPVIPQPDKVLWKKGDFVFSSCTQLQYDKNNQQLQWAIAPLTERLKKAAGLTITAAAKCKKPSVISVKLSKDIANAEGYKLDINSHSIQITAQQPAGVFYAVQSLLQLLPVEIESPSVVNNIQWKIPAVTIEDAPRFAYRGVMLDVARHYMALDSVKRIIDLLAKQKNNRFHWHLTDSQGWRFQSKKYPKLTEIGAYRKGTPLNTTYDYNSRPNDTLYGGYYTQEQMKEIVQYAAERFITVVPEIEMPAHSKSALASYPELACLDSNGHPFPYPQQIQDEYCTKDETFTFLTNILTEVMAIFPSEYIHIAGDEAAKDNWKKCPYDIQRMKEEGLKDVEELQSYFVKRIAQFVNSQGRKVIGWDEIMQGGLAPGAAVMSWTGIENGIKAAQQHHNVVMTPGGYCYFDHYQSDAPGEPVAWGGYTPLPKVYGYEPVPAELNAAQAGYIMGAQGNLWTEFIPTAAKAEYMIFPRAIALAEVTWSQPQQKNYSDFIRRLIPYLKRLDYKHINYSRHLLELKLDDTVTANGQVMVTLSGAENSNPIHYTLDGSEPTMQSPVYTQPIPITKSSVITAAVMMEGSIVGRLKRGFILHKGVGKSATLAIPPSQYYNKGGVDAWHNGSLGNDERYDDDEWLGWSGKPFDGTINFGTTTSISKLHTRFFHKPSAWIWMPKKISVMVSDDGTNFKTVAEKELSVPASEGAAAIELSWPPVSARYIRIVAEPYGIIPENNGGAGSKAWLFADEMVVE